MAIRQDKMGRATRYIEKLKNNEVVIFRPRGNLMVPRIHSGDQVTVESIKNEELKIGDIVLCKVAGNEYLHLIKGVRNTGEQFLIGNNKGGINGWTSKDRIYGILRL
jgi:SOS-response transcriptional repressor LexA